jgi:hypothetical protein
MCGRDAAREMYCRACGYNLRSLREERCPECGRAFRADDPKTYFERPYATWAALVARPPQLWSSALAVLGALAFLIGRSSPTSVWHPSVWLIGGSFVLVFVSVECILRGMAVIGCILRHKPRPIDRRRRWRWAVVPAVLLVVVSGAVTSWPLQLRFRLSQPSFERVARQYLSGELGDRGPRWVGLYWISEISSYETGEVEFATGTRMFSACGFVYCPPESPMHKHRFGWHAWLAENWTIGQW